MIFLTCALEKPGMRYFYCVIPLTTLFKYDNIELYCKWCKKIHSYTLEEKGLQVKTW